MEYTTAEVNRTDDGDIDIDYYRQAAKDIIKREAEADGIDLSKVSSNTFNALLCAVYRSLFRPDGRKEGQRGQKASKTGYTESEAETIAQIYVELCNIYNVRPSAYGFGLLTGIDETKTLQHLTAASSKVSKATKNAVLNKAFDHPVGVLALANNDPETGLMFARQNMITAHEIKHVDDINELENMRRGNVSRIESYED